MVFICDMNACMEIAIFRLTREVRGDEEAPSVESVVAVALLCVGQLAM